MSQRLYVATRKGLFTVEHRGPSGWAVTGRSFLGDCVNYVRPDRRDATVYATLKHGHFGAKMHRSADGGASWEECAVPTYPPRPEGEEDRDMWGKPIPWK